MGETLRAVMAGMWAATAAVGRGIASVFGAAFDNDDMRNAAQRGAAELGEALKAFPDSLSAHESGTLWGNGHGSDARIRAAGGYALARRSAAGLCLPGGPGAGP